MKLAQALFIFVLIYIASFILLYDGSVLETLQYSIIMWTIVMMIKR
ncbi:hypothetical protein [Lysinibacillus endophyticus]|nr:hypothetical protein [Lysinibacillus endophyticus]MCP1143420.1 hypothetical protein [Lysinibacillus endophyticus]